MNDSLLEIFDRGQYDADVSRLIGLATATNPLSLAVIDLDKFKVVNDTYGHAAGDEVLKKVARVVRLACEGKGSCYRYGGDEMAMLLPNYNVQEAIGVAERVRFGVSQLKFELCPEQMTTSIGVTSYPECTKTPTRFFLEADDMMYKAKEAGGNQVRGNTTNSDSNSVSAIRLDIASRVEAVSLWMRLLSGQGRGFSAMITNDSDEDVTIEAITLRRDKVFLSEPAKPPSAEDWRITSHTSKTINWSTSIDPVQRLRTKEPGDSRYPGQIIEIDIVAWGRVLGRLRQFSHTILAQPNYGNYSLTEF